MVGTVRSIECMFNPPQDELVVHSESRCNPTYDELVTGRVPKLKKACWSAAGALMRVVGSKLGDESSPAERGCNGTIVLKPSPNLKSATGKKRNNNWNIVSNVAGVGTALHSHDCHGVPTGVASAREHAQRE